MSRPIEVEIVSVLTVKRNEVWRSVSTMKGVNFELHPFVQMTNPAEHHSLPTAPVPGQTILRSWLLMFGVVTLARVRARRGGVLLCREFEFLAATPMATRTNLG